jgi:hypothetical protein
VLHEEIKMSALAEKVGVIGGNRVDDESDFVVVFPAAQELAVGIKIFETELDAPFAQPARDQLLFVRAEVNPAVPVDQLRKVGVRLRGDFGFSGHPWTFFSWIKNP